ncbi:MAG: F0F1 ATP synthase subunit B [Rhodospirillales bacterium]|nr:F0F1 ATP synthase subunit B [Rhodospirillales bacterium]
MNAWAAETAAHAAEHAEPFYATAEFMVAVALAVFVFLIGRRAFNLLGVALDDRAEKIKNRIDEAARLADEAQAMLATYERKQRDAAEEATSILTGAQREAERLAVDAKRELENALKRREAQALERIAQAEKAAVDEVRGRAVDVAIEATRKLLAERLTPKQQGSLIDAAIAELPKRLH